ncbi:MAG: helix-turn-helix transcriptional regulator [Oscillospiraceae bacterium]
MYLLPKREEIMKRRISKKLSQHQLSLLAGLSGCAVSRIESGATRQTHPLRAKEIARALNCKVGDIFTVPNKEKGA